MKKKIGDFAGQWKGFLVHTVLSLIALFIFLVLADAPIEFSWQYFAKVVLIRFVLLVVEVPILAFPMIFLMKVYFYESLGSKRLRHGMSRKGKIVRTLLIFSLALPLFSYVDCMLFLHFMDISPAGREMYLTSLFLLSSLPGIGYMIYDLVNKIKVFLKQANPGAGTGLSGSEAQVATQLNSGYAEQATTAFEAKHGSST